MKKICVGLFAVIVLLVIFICVKGTDSGSEWGFKNCEKWDNRLIQVQPDSIGEFLHSDENGTYMVYEEGTGFWEFYPSKNQFIGSSVYENFETRSSDIYEYTVLSNDVISVVTPFESFTIEISERMGFENINVFKIKDGNSFEYYLPFKFVKEDKGTFPCTDKCTNGCFKMYIKSNYEEPETTTTEKENQIIFDDYQKNNDNSSEWGFLNIEEWGSALIEIDENSKISSDKGGEYVLIDSYANIFDFDLSHHRINMKQFYNSSVKEYNEVYFQTIDNDSLTMSFDGVTIISINNRICKKSSTVFEMECEGDTRYMIPSVCLGISDSTEILELPIVNVDGVDYYKAYIN